jgi:DNA-binding response OmpR family regulator
MFRSLSVSYGVAFSLSKEPWRYALDPLGSNGWSYGVRVLILEDDPFIAMDLQSILESDGHEVVGMFNTVAEVQEHLEDNFDYALLDIDVTDGKSFDIATKLLDRHIPFAFVSASRPSEVPPSLRQASFIPKPFEERTILRSVAQAAYRMPLLH